MKIVHISEFFINGWKYQENLLPAFQAKLGHEVTLFASLNYPSYIKNGNYDGPEEYIQNGVKIIRYELANSYLVFKMKGIVDMVYEEKPDLLFIHGFHLLRDKNLLQLIKGNYQFKIVMDSHADYFSSGFQSTKQLIRLKAYITYRFIHKRLIQKTIHKLSKFYCVSPASIEFAQEVLEIPNGLITFLPLGISLEDIPYENKALLRKEIRTKYDIPNNAIIIITAGKQTTDKRPTFLAKTFNTLNNPKTYLLIVGSLSDEITQEFSSSFTHNQRIILTGWVNPVELIKIMMAADIAVFPGSQSVLWQHALGCGLPAIFRYWPGVEYLNNGNAFFLYSQDESELSEHLISLIENTDLRKQMGNQARTHCVQNFNYENIAQLSIQ